MERQQACPNFRHVRHTELHLEGFNRHIYPFFIGLGLAHVLLWKAKVSFHLRPDLGRT